MAMNWREVREEIRAIIIPAKGEVLILDFVVWCWDNDIELSEKGDIIYQRFLNFRRWLDVKVSKAYCLAKKLRSLFVDEVAFDDNTQDVSFQLNLCQGRNDCLMSVIIKGKIPKKMSLAYRYRRGRAKGWNQTVNELRDKHSNLFD